MVSAAMVSQETNPSVTPLENATPGDRLAWSSLEPASAEFLQRVKVAQHYQVGQNVFHQGESCTAIYVVEEGVLGLRRSEEGGGTMILRLAHAGDIVGHRAFFAGEPHNASAEALTPCRVSLIATAHPENLIRLDPRLERFFLTRLARDLGSAQNQSVANSRLSAADRVLRVISALARRLGRDEDGNPVPFELPMRRQDLADAVGIRPETLARTLQQLEADGALRFDGRMVTMLFAPARRPRHSDA